MHLLNVAKRRTGFGQHQSRGAPGAALTDALGLEDDRTKPGAGKGEGQRTPGEPTADDGHVGRELAAKPIE